jgi:AbrB family looped-hinge helix DNA binding protein
MGIKMSIQKTVKMNDKGMITIPSQLRKKHKWKEGDEFKILEIEGHLEIIPIFDLDQLPKMSIKKYAQIIDESQAQELELEK